MSELTTADEIEVVEVTKEGGNLVRNGECTDSFEVGRWTNYGKDRLYINEGVAKADKYSLHVDLQSNEVVSDNEHAHEGSVEVDGDTATVTIVSKVGGGDTVFAIDLDVEWEAE